MGVSPLVSMTKVSPNRTSPRNHTIDTISIHCYVGQASIESMANWLCNPGAKASANYGIGSDGRIIALMDENDRSWCTSSRSNDNRAVTIECASDMKAPFAVNDRVYASLIRLCADICRRNGIKELKWRADKSLIGQVDKQNMTVHKWFANKDCPGEYLYSRHGQIASEVNALLHGNVNPSTPNVPENTETNGKFPSTPFSVRVIIDDLNIRNSPSMDGAVLNCTGKGTFTIVKVSGNWGLLKSYEHDGNGWIYLANKNYCEILGEVSDSNERFTVRVDTPNLRIRKGPGTDHALTGDCTGTGTFTIVDVENGAGSSSGWGLLLSYEKDRNGWISLDYTTRI